MIRFLFFISILFLSFCTLSQNSKYTLIASEDYAGVILPIDTKIQFFTGKRFIPAIHEIEELEKFLSKNPEILISETHSGKEYCPIIPDNMENYLRQYIAYYQDTTRILMINAFWKEDVDVFPDWKTEYVRVLDGCTYYWRVYFDVDQQKIIGIDFNSEN